MSLYLHSDITPDTIRDAKRAGITGVKSYPAGVTTNSSSGVVDYESFYPVFATMEEVDMVLNLHGEVPSTPGSDITVLNAEQAFLPTLLDLHKRFPKLRIILEHCTTAAAIQAVQSCGPNVAATITAHHLYLTIDSWAGDPYNFCKPVAKLPSDRLAVLRAAASGERKFFFGSDSAPHPKGAKLCGEDGLGKISAGVFTQPYCVPLVLEAFERAVEAGMLAEGDVTEEKLVAFLGANGRAFYKVEDHRQERVRLQREQYGIMPYTQSFKFHDRIEVVNFMRGGALNWKVDWVSR